jgi:hypothetical protein
MAFNLGMKIVQEERILA